MTTSIVEFKHATVSYGGVHALEDLSFRIEAGECIALLGPNGAGKTTLLTAVNGFTPLTSGSVHVFGQLLRPGRLSALRCRIGYVAQSQPVDPGLPISLRESVMTGLYGRLGWRGKLGSTHRDLVDAVLDRLRILSLAKRPLGLLSGGELRRTMIARALVQQPELLLLDEPTASLDDAARDDILDLLATLHKEEGLTLLWVTHDLDALPRTCTRTVRMRNGAITEDNPTTTPLHRDQAHFPAVGSSFSAMPVFTSAGA